MAQAMNTAGDTSSTHPARARTAGWRASRPRRRGGAARAACPHLAWCACARRAVANAVDIISGLIVRIARSGTLPWDDHQLAGAQKFHAQAVPRVGGLAVILGLVALTAWVMVTGRRAAR